MVSSLQTALAALECESARKDGELAEERSFLGGEQIVAPVHEGTHGLLARQRSAGFHR